MLAWQEKPPEFDSRYQKKIFFSITTLKRMEITALKVRMEVNFRERQMISSKHTQNTSECQITLLLQQAGSYVDVWFIAVCYSVHSKFDVSFHVLCFIFKNNKNFKTFTYCQPSSKIRTRSSCLGGDLALCTALPFPSVPLCGSRNTTLHLSCGVCAT